MKFPRNLRNLRNLRLLRESTGPPCEFQVPESLRAPVGLGIYVYIRVYECICVYMRACIRVCIRVCIYPYSNWPTLLVAGANGRARSGGARPTPRPALVAPSRRESPRLAASRPTEPLRAPRGDPGGRPRGSERPPGAILGRFRVDFGVDFRVFPARGGDLARGSPGQRSRSDSRTICARVVVGARKARPSRNISICGVS